MLRLTKWYDSKAYEDVSAIRIWRILTWIGSIGLGLTAFLFVADKLHFEYTSLKDIVGVPAFMLYPELQDWDYYLLALAVIPLLAVLGYGVWVGLLNLHQRVGSATRQSDVVFVTLTYLLWWILPLTYAYSHRFGPIATWQIGGLFVASNGTFVVYRWLQRRALSKALEMPPSLSLQGAIALLGAGLGMSLLTSPWTTPLLDYPFRTLFGSAILFWGLWFGGAYLLSRALRQTWQDTAVGMAVGSLPLSMLLLVDVLWWEARQDGVLVVSYGSTWAIALLLVVALVATIAVTIWTLRALIRDGKSWDRAFWRWFFGLSVPLLLFGLFYKPNIYQPLDLFHEGERVSTAQALMAGQTPYKDVVFVHGFFRDPGVALVAFRLFDVSVAAVRSLEQFLYALFVVAAYYLALACLGGSGALLYSFLTMTGFWPWFHDWRIVPSLGALTCLVIYVRRRRLRWVVSAGFLTFVALFIAIDTGLVTLVSAAALCMAVTLARWREVKLAVIMAYAMPVLLGLGSVVLYFVSTNSLLPFIEWHRQIQEVARDWSGLPFPLPPADFGKTWEAFLSPVASMIAIAVLLVAFIRRRLRTWHWILLLLLVANVLLFNRGVVKGHTSGWALAMGSHFAPLILLVLLRSFVAQNRLLDVSIAAVLALTLLVPTPTRPADGWSMLDILGQLPEKNRVAIPPTWVESKLERIGPLYLPPDQERSLEEITAFLEGESFWDFTDHGALFFLSNSQSPTRFYFAQHAATGEHQQEVISDLAQNPPRYVLYRSGTWWDAIQGVDRTIRSFLVSEYLLRNYHLVGEVGGFLVLERGAPSSTSEPLAFRVDLGHVPYLWGRDRIGALEELQPAVEAGWDFAEGDPGDWQPVQHVSLSEIGEGGWLVRTEGSDPQLQNLSLDLDSRSVTYVALRMQVATREKDRVRAQLFWRAGSEGFSEEKSVILNLVPDEQEHLYLLRLASFPSWTWSEPVTGLRFDPASTPGVEVVIRSIDLVRINELGVYGE